MMVVAKLVLLFALVPASNGAIRGASLNEANKRELVWLLSDKQSRQLMGSSCPDPAVSIWPRPR